MSLRLLLATLALSFGIAAAAMAHHGFGGRYDRSSPIYLIGNVETAYFGYPHAEVTITVEQDARELPNDTGVAEFLEGLSYWDAALGTSIEIEFPPVDRFFELEGRIRPGDRIAVIALRNCEAPHQLRGQWIAPPDGPAVVREGRMQSEIDGC